MGKNARSPEYEAELKRKLIEIRGRAGRNIIYLRRQGLLSQKDLAELTGLSVATVCSMERGNRGSYIQSYLIFSDLLGVPLGEMLDREFEDDPEILNKVLNKLILRRQD